MAKRRVSNPLALAVLGCLAERPMHPYEISTTLRTRGKEQSIKLNYGSLYSVVESLQKHGLIAAPGDHARGHAGPSAPSTRSPPPASRSSRTGSPSCSSTPVREFTSLEAGLSLMPGLPPDEVARLLERPRRPAAHRAARASTPSSPTPRRWGCPSSSSSRAATARRMLQAELDFVDRAGRATSARTTLAGHRWPGAASTSCASSGDQLRGDLARPGRATSGRRPPLAPLRPRRAGQTETPGPVRQHRTRGTSPEPADRDGQHNPRRTRHDTSARTGSSSPTDEGDTA